MTAGFVKLILVILLLRLLRRALVLMGDADAVVVVTPMPHYALDTLTDLMLALYAAYVLLDA